MSIWREPNDETHDYPGLCLHDGRVAGSITTGCSRLPLWCFVSSAILGDWDEDVEKNWKPEEHYGWTAEKMAEFLHDLLQQRGEFGRLLMILADAERRERRRPLEIIPWWERKTQRARVLKQLKRCMEALEKDGRVR